MTQVWHQRARLNFLSSRTACLLSAFRVCDRHKFRSFFFFFNRCSQKVGMYIILKNPCNQGERQACVCNQKLRPIEKKQKQQHAARLMLNPAQSPWWVDDFSCKVTLTQWIRNQVTGSGFIRWLQPSWQTARWAGRTNGHWFFNKGPEAVSQPGYGDIFSHGAGLLLMMAWLAPDHRPPHWHSLLLTPPIVPAQCPPTPSCC